MEILKNYVGTVQFPVPSSLTAATFVIKKDGELVGPGGAAVVSNGVATVAIPYRASVEEGKIEVELTIDFESNSHTLKKTVDVVTPILDNFEILEIHPNATAKEVGRIEKATRHIINAHTGQRFGARNETKTVRGGGSRSLLLPERLLEINSINGIEAGEGYELDANGWVLYHFPWGVPPVKADFFGLHQHQNGVIHNPYHVNMGEWIARTGYEIDGRWGWEEVPDAVKEAAMLLVNDYACADQAYRDRYLTSMTAADWRIQFNSGAFRETGNVRADQLLKDYVLKRGWAVI